MIQVTADAATNEALEKEVDADIDAYSRWCQERLKSQPLDPSERAIIKTYLWFKVKEADEPADKTTKLETSDGT